MAHHHVSQRIQPSMSPRATIEGLDDGYQGLTTLMLSWIDEHHRSASLIEGIHAFAQHLQSNPEAYAPSTLTGYYRMILNRLEALHIHQTASDRERSVSGSLSISRTVYQSLKHLPSGPPRSSSADVVLPDPASVTKAIDRLAIHAKATAHLLLYTGITAREATRIEHRHISSFPPGFCAIRIPGKRRERTVLLPSLVLDEIKAQYPNEAALPLLYSRRNKRRLNNDTLTHILTDAITDPAWHSLVLPSTIRSTRYQLLRSAGIERSAARGYLGYADGGKYCLDTIAQMLKQEVTAALRR
jgi:hypothetical protein